MKRGGKAEMSAGPRNPITVVSLAPQRRELRNGAAGDERGRGCRHTHYLYLNMIVVSLVPYLCFSSSVLEIQILWIRDGGVRTEGALPICLDFFHFPFRRS